MTGKDVRAGRSGANLLCCTSSARPLHGLNKVGLVLTDNHMNPYK